MAAAGFGIKRSPLRSVEKPFPPRSLAERQIKVSIFPPAPSSVSSTTCIAARFSALELFHSLPEQLSDLEMLRADVFAPAAADAVGGAASRPVAHDGVIKPAVPVPVELLRVHGGEDLRDRNVHRAARRAVAAGRAGDEILRFEDALHL